MNTTRRAFLARLAAAAGLTALAARANAGHSLSYTTQKQAIDCTGVAIKVPSNRLVHYGCTYDELMRKRALGEWVSPSAITYEGNWDGTFRLECGCTNPAYILADLYERMGAEPDWAIGEMWYKPSRSGWVENVYRLNWAILYDWGRFCDELVPVGLEYRGGTEPLHALTNRHSAPRFTVETVCQTREDMDRLREELRMHCLSWQSQDPRYRTSYPGIPYPAA